MTHIPIVTKALLNLIWILIKLISKHRIHKPFDLDDDERMRCEEKRASERKTTEQFRSLDQIKRSMPTVEFIGFNGHWTATHSKARIEIDKHQAKCSEQRPNNQLNQMPLRDSVYMRM